MLGNELMTVGDTKLSLELPKDQSFDEWVEVGKNLASASKVLNWWIGDWWNAGERRYGESRAAAEALSIFDKEYDTVRACGWACGKFEPVRRRTNLSFTHHREVAALASHEADELLEKAARDNWTVRDIRAEASLIRSAAYVGSSRDTSSEGREWSALVGAWNRARTAIRERFLGEMNGTEPIE